MSALNEARHISGFEVLTKLSSGGMGEVLLARKTSAHGFEKLFAIKTIRGELARRPDIRAMFLDEARLVARLDHPSIAQVYDFGEHDGSLYLAMEYVAGIPLNKLLIKRQAPLPALVAARIASEAARGLHAAHQLPDRDGVPLGVVHRDVSPGNLILTFDGHVKILDFGIAFMNERESPDTQLGELKGKPSYMAPEQLRCERVDRRSDVYSLSVVLHEMLTGRKLYSKTNVVATALAVERGEVPVPSEIVGALPDGLDGIVMRGLERDPEERFVDAKVMAESLEEILQEASALPLSVFVEDELELERTEHRDWLKSTLRGETDDLAVIPQASIAGDSATKELEAALAGPTTLIPPAGTDQHAVHAQGSNRGPLLLALAAFGGVAVVFLLLSWLRPQAPIVASLPEDAPTTPAEVTTGRVVDAPPTPAVVPTAAAEPDAGQAPDEATTTTEKATDDKPVPAKTKQRRRRVARRRPPPAERAPPPPRVEEKKSEGTGYVTIGAQPYALVRINGKEIGTTPVVRRAMPAGSYEIQFISPASGEVRATRSLRLRPDQHARVTVR